MPFLRYQDSTGVHYYELGAREKIYIGRDQTCDIPLNDNQASRRHCEVKRHPGGYIINDLNSKNGTKVNGVEVSSWTLKEDDLITVGGSNLLFKKVKG